MNKQRENIYALRREISRQGSGRRRRGRRLAHISMSLAEDILTRVSFTCTRRARPTSTVGPRALKDARPIASSASSVGPLDYQRQGHADGDRARCDSLAKNLGLLREERKLAPGCDVLGSEVGSGIMLQIVDDSGEDHLVSL